MNTGRYTLKSFLTDHNLDQIIIPEIQRDYVWQEENVTKLLQSIFENAERQTANSSGTSEEELNKMVPEIREAVMRVLEQKKNYCNVGFLYAYFDPDLAGRFMLIDGQQRMTTLFLIMLCLSVKENKQDQFRRSYFKDGFLKFDYKVREASHDFMLNFVEHILSGNDIAAVIDQYWYFSEYRNDVTIQSVFNNYKVINDFISANNLSLQYVEDFIEFWYFDTNKSKQGEELYIYMNSRGESVSASENIKATLLKGLSEQEKHDWGSKWEKWQNLFWKQRKENINADKGLEEFLRWIKIIELTKIDSKKSIDKKAEIIREVREKNKISVDGLSLTIIESYFTALSVVLNYKDDVKLNSEWLTGSFAAIDYLKFLPTLMYAEKYPNCSKEDIQRFSRFFFNISRFTGLSKNPFESLASTIGLTKLFLDANYSDIADLIELKEKNSFESILTSEEISKLTIYKQSQADLRKQIETAFWSAEDFKFCDGKVWFIWHCIDYDPSQQSFDTQKLSDFNYCFSNFKLLFDSPTNLLRRALLTKGDYSAYDGRTSTLEGDRYSFINEDWRWKPQFASKGRIEPYKLLINDFGLIQQQNSNLTKDDILKQIISTFLTTAVEKNWIYYFVKEPSVLDYCRQKLVCFQTVDLDKIILLEARNAAQNNWTKLNEYIKFED
jgi:uncharacterized protein with ParB-like and HNH nuclease domain